MADIGSEWNGFLVEFSKHFTKYDVKLIKFYLQVPAGTGENIKDGLDLMTYLKNQDKIREDDFSELYNIADAIDKPDLKNVLDKFLKKEEKKIEEKRRQGMVYSPPNTADPVYKMTSESRGLCLIINNIFQKEIQIQGRKSYNFLRPRRGAEREGFEMKVIFEWLKFEVQVHTDVTKDHLHRILSEARDDKRHKDYDCFVCFISSYGDEDGFYSCDGEIVNMSEVKNYFNGDKCPLLHGKPKLFFVQADHGSNYGAVQKLKDDLPTSPVGEEKDNLSKQESTYCTMASTDFSVNHPPVSQVSSLHDIKGKTRPSYLSVEADTLIFSSSTPGTYSWRNTMKGSWFIQELCDVFTEHAQHKEILHLCKEVNRRVSARTANFAEERLYGQMPNISFNTLRYDLFFRPGCSFVVHQSKAWK